MCKDYANDADFLNREMKMLFCYYFYWLPTKPQVYFTGSKKRDTNSWSIPPLRKILEIFISHLENFSLTIKLFRIFFKFQL